MPKRKRNEKDSLDYIKKKIKKLEKKLSKRRSSSSSDSQQSFNNQAEQNIENDVVEDLTLSLDAPGPSTSEPCRASLELMEECEATLEHQPQILGKQIPEAEEILPEQDAQLDDFTLEILGENPSNTKAVGKNIQKDLAVRFEFIATSGLDKDLRKQLIESHLPPANCKLIDSPALNPEIKVAVTDLIQKRDKAMQVKQKQMCSAISCLSEAISLLLTKEPKDPVVLKLLMDTGRLLCDCQYNDSITRRNFILAALKKELKDQLRETKIDHLLFSEQLADTLKTAKAINRSGAELKAAQPYKPLLLNNQKPQTAPPKKNLNWKAPPLSRRPTGTPRAKEPAPPRAQHAPSSRASRPTSARGRR